MHLWEQPVLPSVRNLMERAQEALTPDPTLPAGILD